MSAANAMQVTAPITSAIESDADRVSRLFDTESVTLLGYFLRRVDNREDAADLVSDTALTLWRRAADAPADDTEARMWMFGIARRVLATHRRGHSRRLALADRLRDELGDIPSTESVDDRAAEVRRAVESLPRREQELIGLVHWEGFTVTQAAEVIGIRPGAAHMRYSRARQRLQVALGD